MSEPTDASAPASASATTTKAAPQTDISGAPVQLRKRKFHNGWTDEQEELMAKWSDTAACYRWLHDRCEKMYSKNNMRMTIPVIILTTVTGTASVGLSSIVGDNKDAQKYGQFAIGGVSLIAGILTTLANFFKYAQLSESNRVASISWGKFQRQLAIELSLHPDDRIDSMDFIKICRVEQDRLIEQSPPIPDDIINAFEREFKDLPDLKRPDICHGIEHTRPFKDKKSRMKQVASEMTMLMFHKKKALKEILVPDLDNKIAAIIDSKIDELRTDLQSRSTITVTSDTKPHKSAHVAFDSDSRRMLSSAPSLQRMPSSAILSATRETPLLPKRTVEVSDIKIEK